MKIARLLFAVATELYVLAAVLGYVAVNMSIPALIGSYFITVMGQVFVLWFYLRVVKKITPKDFSWGRDVTQNNTRTPNATPTEIVKVLILLSLPLVLELLLYPELILDVFRGYAFVTPFFVDVWKYTLVLFSIAIGSTSLQLFFSPYVKQSEYSEYYARLVCFLLPKLLGGFALLVFFLAEPVVNIAVETIALFVFIYFLLVDIYEWYITHYVRQVQVRLRLYLVPWVFTMPCLLLIVSVYQLVM